MAKYIKGADLMLFVGGKSIAYATSHTLGLSMETLEVSTKDNSGKWAEAEGSIISWTLSSDNLVSDSGKGQNIDDVIDMMLARTPVDVIFTREKNSPDYDGGKLEAVPDTGWTPDAKGYKGKALITDVQVTADNGSWATASITLTGVGELTKVGASGFALAASASKPVATTKA